MPGDGETAPPGEKGRAAIGESGNWGDSKYVPAHGRGGGLFAKECGRRYDKWLALL